MSEIFVEEENTVYELDEECLKRKKKEQETKKGGRYKAQAAVRGNGTIGWLLLVLILFHRT